VSPQDGDPGTSVTRHDPARPAPFFGQTWQNTSRRRRIVKAVVALPGVLALVLMLASWLLPRTRPAVFLVLAGLVVLFVAQFVSARRFERGPIRAAMMAFSVALLYFAVFGVLYAEYADLSNNPKVFSTDQLGEVFLLSASIGTATGYVPGAAGGGNAGFLFIVHAQMVILALGVASSVASAMARVVKQRTEVQQRLSADAADDEEGKVAT
jgi:hypothetical protein